MPRNKNYDKHKALALIQEKRYYQSLVRDIRKAMLKRYYNMVDVQSEILENKYNLEYLIYELRKQTDALKKDPENKQIALDIAILTTLIWDYLEMLEKK